MLLMPEPIVENTPIQEPTRPPVMVWLGTLSWCLKLQAVSAATPGSKKTWTLMAVVHYKLALFQASRSSVVSENVIRAWRAYSRWCARQSQHLWLVGMAPVFRMPAFQCIATHTLEFCISGRTQRNRRGHRGTYQWKRKQQLPILCLLDVCTKSQHLFINKRLNDFGRFNVAMFLVWPLEKRNSNDCFFLRFALASKKRKKSWLFTLALLL